MSAPPHMERRRAGWHWGWTLGLTFLLLAGAAAVVLHSPWFKVRHIEIAGAGRADVAARLAQAGVGEGAFLLWLRTGEVEEAVLADPWVSDVRAERVFPDTLVVEVLERVPIVWVGEGDRWFLLADDGVIVAAAGAPGSGLLRARLPWEAADLGEAPSGGEWAELVGLGSALSPSLAAEAWVTSQGGELWLAARGFPARLGAAVDLADKGRAFEALVESGLPEGAVIDLVAPTRPAVAVPGPGSGDSGEGDTDPVVEGEDDG